MTHCATFRRLGALALALANNLCFAATLNFESRTPQDFADLMAGTAPAQPMTAQVHWPPGSSTPVGAVVFTHGSGGVGANEDLFRTVALQAGLAVVIVDSFTPRGVRSTADNQGAVSYAAQVADNLFVLKALAKESAIDMKRVGIFGLSRGGMVAHFAAHEPLVEAVAGGGLRYSAHFALTPACNAQLDIWKVRAGAPIFIALGEKDDYTPPSSCQSVIQKFQQAGAALTVKAYAGAYHAFAHINSRYIYSPRAQRIRTDKACPIVTSQEGTTSIVTEGLAPGSITVGGNWSRFFGQWMSRCGTTGGTIGSEIDHQATVLQDFARFFERLK